MQTLSISEARNNLTRLPKRFQKAPEPVEIRQRGRPVMVLLSWELYEGLLETLEVLGDAALMRTLRGSLKDIRQGKTYSTSEIEGKLGL